VRTIPQVAGREDYNRITPREYHIRTIHHCKIILFPPNTVKISRQ